MSRLEILKQKRTDLATKEKSLLSNMDLIIAENYRVADVAHNAQQTLDDLDSQFEKLTKLNKFDVSFLFAAIALQCARQYLISNDKFRFDKASKGDRFIKNFVPKDYQEILLAPVPYDAFKLSEAMRLEDTIPGLSGANHRYTVLGHDPLLGWIFGPLNILTDSVTKSNIVLESYRVINSTRIDQSVRIDTLFYEGYEQVSADNKLIAAAVARHALHMGSDAFTKMGLPVPAINTVAPSLTSTLMKNGIDVYSITRGAAIASLINSFVAALHGLYYDEEKYKSRDLYEVKTRKILSYSNLIATTSNVIFVAMSPAIGNGNALKYLDVGGMLVTIYRLINDYEFIRKVKEEFVFGSFNNLIQGQDYKFEES